MALDSLKDFLTALRSYHTDNSSSFSHLYNTLEFIFCLIHFLCYTSSEDAECVPISEPLCSQPPSPPSFAPSMPSPRSPVREDTSTTTTEAGFISKVLHIRSKVSPSLLQLFGRFRLTSRITLSGVVVQSADNGFGEPSTFVDPLALPDACARDLPFLKDLGINAIRIYSVDSSLNHDACMKAFSDAGIYTL